ncbi:hypothetical protein [Salinibacter sp.]|uniref:hypothetical protein n=1 Tax=Salinibacter sp. TaxID=2065818 RepID=UPI0021E7F0F5|nr:hypothetical protein [Salinibacter sp.]
MADTDSTENERREPNGTTLTEEEWIETLNKHDSFDQYAKRRKESGKDASDGSD